MNATADICRGFIDAIGSKNLDDAQHLDGSGVHAGRVRLTKPPPARQPRPGGRDCGRDR